jgi:hypothetical protein
MYVHDKEKNEHQLKWRLDGKSDTKSQMTVGSSEEEEEEEEEEEAEEEEDEDEGEEEEGM